MGIARIDSAAEDILNDLRKVTGKAKKRLLAEALIYYRLLVDEASLGSQIFIEKNEVRVKEIIVVTKYK